MALKKNKVKFGLNKVHYAKITSWTDDGVPTFATPVRIPGAVSLSIDAEGEAENFFADNGVYYVINNNAGEKLDNNGVLVERNDAELAEFALLFEFEGDKNKIRHVLYRCSASRPATESATTEDETELKTETLSIKATTLPDGLVKSKTCENTDETTYNNWYKNVYIPVTTAAAKSAASTKSAS